MTKISKPPFRIVKIETEEQCEMIYEALKDYHIQYSFLIFNHEKERQYEHKRKQYIALTELFKTS